MPLSDLLAPNAIFPALKAANKKQVLQELSAEAAKLAGGDERKIFEILLQRERLGSTGIGHGIAIPHGKLPKIERLFGLFARLSQADQFRGARRRTGRSRVSVARARVGGRRSPEGARVDRAAVAGCQCGEEAARRERGERDLLGTHASAGGDSRGLK